MTGKPQWVDLVPETNSREDGPEVVPSGRIQVQELIEDNGGRLRDVLPLVLAIVKKVRARNKSLHISHEELVAVGLAALARCRFRFTPRKGRKLTTYAFLPIQGAIQDHIEAELRHYGRETPVDPEMLHTVPGPNHYEEKLSNELLFEAVLAALDRVNPDGAYVVRKHFLEGVPEYKLAEEMGVTSHVIADLRKKAFAEVRAILGEKPRTTGGWVASPEN